MAKPLFVLTLSLLVVGQTSYSHSARADELFSRVPIDSVFAPTSPAPAGSQAAPRQVLERGQKVLSVSQLADLLRDAGLEPEIEAERFVNVKLQYAKWTFDLALALTESRDEIEVVLKLNELESSQLPADKLLALLAANREHQPAVFAFSEKRKRLELWRSVTNIDVSPRTLRDEMRRLTAIAESTANLWETANSGGSPLATAPVATQAAPPNAVATPSGPAPATTPQASQPAAKAASPLTGKWSAARSAKEAFALLLKDDGTFVLVYVKDGKQTRSTGQFTLSGTQLTLAGSDGGKLAGTVGNVTATSFEFTPQAGSAAKLTFQKAS
jgi:hypothetical protein